MKDGSLKACIGMICVVALYGIYTLNNPGTDGYVFATVAAIVGGLAGYAVAIPKPKE